MTSDVVVASLGDYRHLVPVVAGWHWNEWGHADPEGSLETWIAALARRTNVDRTPGTFIAIEDGAPVGSVSLLEHDMPDRHDLAHLTPWLAGLFVIPTARRRGYGTLLVEHCQTWARSLGIPTMYLYTAKASAFYASLGWLPVRRDRYEGDDVTIMRRDT